MYPKNKTQLIKWFCGNVGAKLTLQRGVRFFELDGSTLIQESMTEPLERIVNKAQTNAVNFYGEEFDKVSGKKIVLSAESGVNPTWLYFDQKGDSYEFSDNGFIQFSQPYETYIGTDSEQRRVIKQNFLLYSWHV